MPRNPGDREYTEAQRGVMAYRVNVLLEDPAAVAGDLGCDPKTVVLWSTKNLHFGHERNWAQTSHRPGRQQYTTASEQMQIVEGAFEQPLRHNSYPKEAAELFNCSRVAKQIFSLRLFTYKLFHFFLFDSSPLVAFC